MKRINPCIFMVAIFLLVYTSSIFLADEFIEAGIKAFEKPDDPRNIIYIIFTLLFITAVIILISKFWKKEINKFLILFAVATTIFTVFQSILGKIFENILSSITSMIISILIVMFLLFYPEWYVIDISAILLSIGATVIFGISLSIPLTVALLIILILYDAISVYKTKHMIDLADTFVDLKLPVLFVIPHRLNYRFRKDTGGIKKQIKRKEREAMFVGVGDVTIPGTLVVSTYISTFSIVIPLSVITGIISAFIILAIIISKGKPQAGLPFLNIGAILGYFISSLIIYRSLVGFSI